MSITTIDEFGQPVIHRLDVNPKDFGLLHGVLLGEAIVRVRGRDKKSAERIQMDIEE